MPRYFFHVEDGLSMPDIEGTVLADVAAAREESIRLFGALISEYTSDLWEGEVWFMEVHDEADRVLFTLSFAATEGPRCRKVQLAG